MAALIGPNRARFASGARSANPRNDPSHHAPRSPRLLIIVAAAAILLAMGRPPICTCGEVALWEPSAASARTSQMLADWYSPSHIVHGFLFYAALWLVARALAGRAALPRRAC